MALYGKVPNIAKFRIIKIRNIVVGVIAIRSHIKGRSYARSVKILCSECSSADCASKTTSDEGVLYMDCLRLVEAIDFDI